MFYKHKFYLQIEFLLVTLKLDLVLLNKTVVYEGIGQFYDTLQWLFKRKQFFLQHNATKDLLLISELSR